MEGGNKADGQENKKSYGISVKKTSCAMHTFPSMTPLNRGSKPILSVKIYRQFFNKLGLKILIFKIDVIALHYFRNILFVLCIG